MGLLSLLAEGPSHGYELKASFEARTGGVWTVNVGQVYSTLERLQTDGFVEPADPVSVESSGRDRRPWAITEAGRAALQEWFDDVDVGGAPPRDDFLVKLLLALGRSRDEALAVVDRHRAELYRLAQAERRQRSRSPDVHPAAELMAEAVAARREADLRWLDQCEAVITARTSKESTP